MKTKLFFGLTLSLLLFTACEEERAREITQPSVQPLEAEAWSDLEAADTQIEIFEHIRPGGRSLPGLQHLKVSNPDEEHIRYFTAGEIQDFYEAYSAEVSTEETNAESSTDQAVPDSKKSYQVRDNRPRKLINNCEGYQCQEAIRTEIQRLQQIARHNCLSMVASFNCCESGNAREIMVYLTPGVQCERRALAQNRKNQFSSTY